MKLRHAPLLLAREMARHKTHRGLVAETLERVLQRADELCEFVAIYWKGRRVPLSGQVKKGLAAAFPKFDEYHSRSTTAADRSSCATSCFSVTQSRVTTSRPALEETDLGPSRGARHLGGLLSARAPTSARPGRVCSPRTSWALSLCSATYATCARPGSRTSSCSRRCAVPTRSVCCHSAFWLRLVTLRSGRGARAAHAEVGRRTAEADWQDRGAGRRLGLDELGALEAFGDEGAPTRLTVSRYCCARSASRWRCTRSPITWSRFRRAVAFACATRSKPRRLTTAPSRKGVEELNATERYDRLIVITDEQAHDTVPNPKGRAT